MSGFCDPLAGMHAVAAITLALRERDRTGRGTVIEVPQCEVLDSLFAPEMIAVQAGSPVPRARGNNHEWMAPHNTYRVAGEDRWLSLAIGSDEEFRALCQTLGVTFADDARFATAGSRKANETALDGLLDAALAGRDGGMLEAALQSKGVPAARVAKGWELPDDENLRHIGFFQELERALTGRHSYKTWPFRLHGLDSTHKRPAPFLGEHTGEVLAEMGLTAEEIETLAAEGITGTRPLGL
jgi:crotonobetainyl-CoA:carnitine CoA-transferase CaiB-like acyl-CoA transferase